MDTLIAAAICPITAIVFITLGYWSWCQVRPFKPCRKCRGAGIKRLMLRRTRHCSRCQGTGYVIRLGPKIANHLRRFANELDKGRK